MTLEVTTESSNGCSNCHMLYHKLNVNLTRNLRFMYQGKNVM
jgi:hypothetical protein